MTVNVGTMQLPVTEDADLVRTYLNGTHVSGGLWTALTRASNHDHSGGLNGIQLTATSIPDGSITTAKLDPSVLLPYALVDGSKPFTGQVTMAADAIVRDTVYFGQQGTGLAPDTALSRVFPLALRMDGNLWIGVAPEVWEGAIKLLRVGATGAMFDSDGYTQWSNNTCTPGIGVNTALVTGPASKFYQYQGAFNWATAPSAAAGAAQGFVTRMAMSPAGTLTMTPEVGQASLVAQGNAGVKVTPSAWRGDIAALQVGATGAVLGVTPGAGTLLTDNTYVDGAGTARSLLGGAAASQLIQQGGAFTFQVAGSAGGTAGAAQSFVTRAALAQAGTLTLTPDAGLSGLVVERIASPAAQHLLVNPATAIFAPATDNAIHLGAGTLKWVAVYAVNGAIQTSSQVVKEGITPLDPAACYQAAKDVRWYEYAYRPPAYTAPEPPPDIAYDAADDNETKAEKKAARDEAETQAREAHAKMLVETAPARHQRGFVFPAGASAKDEAGGTLPPVPDLFGLSDRESTTPQADLATLGCAMQEIIRRLEALEAQP